MAKPITIEREMRPAIINWLNCNGYEAAYECMVGVWCDVVGSLWSERIGRAKPNLLEMICIELKMRDMTTVIYQAKCNHYHSNLSYCAMPLDFCERMRPRSVQNFVDAGVGLLSVDGESVKIIIYSNYKNQEPDEVFRNRLWSFKLRHRKAK